jgi:hypothetical protein
MVYIAKTNRHPTFSITLYCLIILESDKTLSELKIKENK